ncbi:MAG: ABC transporter ATP-binding protein [Kiritimatiellae bacterium]|nr:ABC transporter ATP-binding protein [Kiritimatiellia bacterium]
MAMNAPSPSAPPAPSPAPAAPPALAVTGVTMRFPRTSAPALDDLSLQVPAGQIFGLVGPNGAGKSTLLRVIAGLLPPTSGTVRVHGTDITGAPARAAHLAGLMPDPLGVYSDLSAAEYLRFFARLFRAPRARTDEVIATLGLGPWLDREVETLSAGWQRRLALGRTLLSGAPLLLLDEPAAGLDVAARADLLQTIRTLAAAGRTLVVSSHILPELRSIADRLAILDRGRWHPLRPGLESFSEADLATADWHLRFPAPSDADRAAPLLPAPVHRDAPDLLRFTPADPARPSDALPPLLTAAIPILEFRRAETDIDRLVLSVFRETSASSPVPPPLPKGRP